MTACFKTDNNKSNNYKINKYIELVGNKNSSLFITDNSCKHCFEKSIKLLPELTLNNNLNLFYIQESVDLDSFKSDKIKLIKKDNLDNFFEIYGITLYEIKSDTLNITYIDPSNIEDIFEDLLKYTTY